MTKGKFLGALALNAIMLGTVTSASCDEKSKEQENGKKAVTMDALLRELKDAKVMKNGKDITKDDVESFAAQLKETDLKVATDEEKKDMSKCFEVKGKTYVKTALFEAIKKDFAPAPVTTPTA